jgi:hypothetical protein
MKSLNDVIEMVRTRVRAAGEGLRPRIRWMTLSEIARPKGTLLGLFAVESVKNNPQRTEVEV